MHIVNDTVRHICSAQALHSTVGDLKLASANWSGNETENDQRKQYKNEQQMIFIESARMDTEWQIPCRIKQYKRYGCHCHSVHNVQNVNKLLSVRIDFAILFQISASFDFVSLFYFIHSQRKRYFCIRFSFYLLCLLAHDSVRSNQEFDVKNNRFKGVIFSHWFQVLPCGFVYIYGTGIQRISRFRLRLFNIFAGPLNESRVLHYTVNPADSHTASNESRTKFWPLSKFSLIVAFWKAHSDFGLNLAAHFRQ